MYVDLGGLLDRFRHSTRRDLSSAAEVSLGPGIKRNIGDQNELTKEEQSQQNEGSTVEDSSHISDKKRQGDALEIANLSPPSPRRVITIESANVDPSTDAETETSEEKEPLTTERFRKLFYDGEGKEYNATPSLKTQLTQISSTEKLIRKYKKMVTVRENRLNNPKLSKAKKAKAENELFDLRTQLRAQGAKLAELRGPRPWLRRKVRAMMAEMPSLGKDDPQLFKEAKALTKLSEFEFS